MSEYFVDSVLKWIKSNLTPFRTTSVSEGMRFSMKNGFDGLQANQSPHVSSGVMMDKSIRNGEEIEIFNTHELDRNITANSNQRGEYSTDYAY